MKLGSMVESLNVEILEVFMVRMIKVFVLIDKNFDIFFFQASPIFIFLFEREEAHQELI